LRRPSMGPLQAMMGTKGGRSIWMND